MTTVIWDGTEMIADTQSNYGGTLMRQEKLFRHEDTIIGFSGEYCAGFAFVLWVKSGMKLEAFPPICEKCTVLMVQKHGTVQRFEGVPYPTPVRELPATIGTGSDFVLGAMAAGASARDAMEIAKRLDVDTGGGLTVLHF